MLFRRRNKPGLSARLSALVRPSGGWRRGLRYLWYRIARLQGSPQRIAVGFACGAAVSMMPLVGLHFLLGALFAWSLRGNLLASALGTLIGNPWTFPLIWLASYQVGGGLLGWPAADGAADLAEAGAAGPLPAAQALDGLWQALLTLDGAALGRQVLPVWGPMMLGALPMAAVAWGLSYLLVRRAIVAARAARAARRPRRPAPAPLPPCPCPS